MASTHSRAFPHMRDSAERDEAGKTQHRQVRMPDDPIGEMHMPLQRHNGLQRPLQAYHQVEQYAGPDES